MWCLLQTSQEYATTDYAPWTYVGGGLNLVFGIVAAIIIGNKGHSGGQVALHLIIGVFCCWPWSLISALAAQDLRAAQQHGQYHQGRVIHERRQAQERQQIAAEHARMKSELSELRQRLNYVDLVQSGTELPVEALPDEQLPSDMSVPEPVKWVEQPASSLPGLMEMRIKCRACGKRFSGPKGKVQLMKKCPKCGATPFDYQQLPAKS